MFRRTLSASLVTASLTAGALLTLPAAQAAPTWTHIDQIGSIGPIPKQATSAVARNGDTVVAWVVPDDGHTRVKAASAKNGEFGPAYFVSEDFVDASYPSVAINQHGDAVVTWVQTDNLDHERLAGSRRLGNGTWDGRSYLTPAADQDVQGQGAQLALDAAGTLRAAYLSTDGGTVHQVRMATWADGAATASTATLSDTTAGVPALDVNGAGDVLVAWLDENGPQDRIMARRKGVAGTWGPATEVSPAGIYTPEVEVELSSSGFGTVAMVGKVNDEYRVWAAKVQANGFVGNPSLVSPAGYSSGAIDLDQNPDGKALLSYVQVDIDTLDPTIGYATRPQDGGWTAGTVPTPVALPQVALAGIGDNGEIFVGYTGNDRVLASYRATPAALWTSFNSGDIDVDEGSTLGGVDSQGNAFLGAVVHEADPTQGHLVGRFLDAAGPTTTLNTLAANKLTFPFGVGWTATDRLSNVGTASVRVRTAVWNAGFGSYTYPALNTPAKSVSFQGTPGRTYCFGVQSKDAVGNLGTWSTEKCTTTPVDDKTLTVVKDFTRGESSAYYRGTYSAATKKGATLKLANIKAKRIAIVVSKAANGGKIQVLLGSKVLGSYSLKGSGTKQVIGQTVFDSVKSGTLVIKVISETGKVVKIDGVVLAK